MRKCFKDLDFLTRRKLFDNVLSRVNKRDPHRQALRNLYSDAATNRFTMDSILSYLSTHGYPTTTEGENRMWSQKNWLRQGGRIRIDNPRFLLSIQKVNTLMVNLRRELYIDYSDDKITSKEFLEILLDIVESRKINKKNYKDEDLPIQIRENSNENMWLTWNELNPSACSLLCEYRDRKTDVLSILGMGFSIKRYYDKYLSDDEYVGLVFDIKHNTSNIELFRPGWGDAKTYYFWRPVLNSNDKYGYTKSIKTGSNLNQPEAVSANENFHLDLISNYSFELA